MAVSEKLFSFHKNFPRGQMRIPAAELRQIAELSVIKGGEIREHLQNCDELTYAISGKATIRSGDHTLEMSAGQVHYIRRGEYHQIAVGPAENFHYCCLGFLPNDQCPEIRSFLEAVRHRKDFLVEDMGDIRALFSLLLNEFFTRDSESDTMIHFYFCQILILLYRILSGSTRETRRQLTGKVSSQAVYRALKFIDSEYLRLTQVKEVAAALSYSEYYLCHVFKETMDMTIKEYLMRKKLMTAVTLLETSSMTVTEISDQLNFASLHAFGLAFRRHMGMSPSEYRRQADSSN